MREHFRNEFLRSCELAQVKVKALAQDASFRRYFRIYTNTQNYILMDAPPEHENIKPFIQIAEHLLSLGLRAPKVIKADETNGFILLEDFGDDTFTRLLTRNHSELQLYQLAINSLIKLQKHPHATGIQIPNYSNELLINEAQLLTDWYYPNKTGNEISVQSREVYSRCWDTILDSLPKLNNTLVLRDFHVDNLIKLDVNECGLLDFQDAVIGSPAYDLVSLLEDARRDINKEIQNEILESYFSQVEYDREKVMRWYHVLGAQRHCKVLGIFTRLSVRDGKHYYLNHIDRVKNLLLRKLSHADLQPLKLWLHENNLT